MHITFSNRLELLFDALCPHLYALRPSPFSKMLVIVPSVGMKNWLIERAASNCRIAFGFEVLLINEAIRKLGHPQVKTLNAVELALNIEQELKILKDHPFQTLFQDPRPSTKKAEIALEIAEIFLKYGEYAKKGWENSSTHWQAHLWKKIYANQVLPLYSYLEKFNPVLPHQIHLFGLSYLSEVKQKFFEQLSQRTFVNFWVLSPSRMLWTDHKSKREQFYIFSCLEKRGVKFSQIQELQEYLEESHPIIGNNTRLGRKWRDCIDDSCSSDIFEVVDHPAFKDYMLDGVKTYPSSSLTLLETIQTDLTLLANSASHVISDRSIEIHSAPSRLREVEVLYETLLKSAVDENISPNEMIVMAPSFEKYIPFIKMIFGKEDSLLPYEILERSPIDSPFFDLIAFTLGRWELETLFDLLKILKGKLKDEELQIVKNLLHKEGTRWGIDFAHREKLSQQPLIEKSQKGTFKGGFEALLHHLTSGGLNNTHAEIFNEFLEFFNQFYCDLTPFLEEKELLISEWKNICFHLITTYLNEDEVLNRVLGHINGEGLYSSKSFFVYLKTLYSAQEPEIGIKNLSAVRFCPLLPMRAIPSKIVALLGMNSDVFPRIERKSPLFMTETFSLPNSTDFDRYIFLESLLSARKKWILSFVDKENESPSCLIQEVLQYLDKFAPHHQVFYKHPDLPFDMKYFTKDSNFNSLSHEQYRRAVACKNKNLMPALEIGPPLPIEALDLNRLPRHLTLHQLKSLFYHPIRYYLNQTHGIYLQKKDFSHPDMEEFSEERLWDSEWLKWALQYPIEKVVELAEAQGKLPFKPFKEASKMRLRKNLTEWKDLLQERGIALESIFECEFSYDCTELKQISRTLWKAPAIEINYYGKSISLTGVLPYVAQNGYLSLRDFKRETLATMLPEMFFLQQLPNELVNPKIYFIKKNKEYPLQKMNWNLLLDHYIRALHQPLPHHPTWIPSLLSENFQNLPMIECPYLKWAFPQGNLMSEVLIQAWRKETSRLFGLLSSEENENI